MFSRYGVLGLRICSDTRAYGVIISLNNMGGIFCAFDYSVVMCLSWKADRYMQCM